MVSLAALSRNASHTYDARVAAQVASAIPAFLEEAEYLYAESQPRLA